MKTKIILGAILCLFIMSCNVTMYPTTTLKTNYDYLMDGKSNAEIVKNFPLYFSENEIKGSFTVISINSYDPFVFLIFGSRAQKLKRYTMQKAVLSAKSQSGDGAIIVDENHWKVIKMNK